jgi:hypothetical protein
MGGNTVNRHSGPSGPQGPNAVERRESPTDVHQRFVQWSQGSGGTVRHWVSVSPEYSQYLPLLGNDTGQAASGPNFDAVSKVVYSGAGPVKGTVFLCVDDSYKGSGTAGDAEYLKELEAALGKTDFGKFYEVRLITAKDGLETLARHEAMCKPPNISLVLHGDPKAANERWNAAVGRTDFPFETFGVAPGKFAQPVSVGPCASKAEYANPKLMALVSCHEIGHRLYNMADGVEKGMRRADGSTDHSGGWGDFPNVAGAKPGEPGSLNLMWDGGAMIQVFSQYQKQGKPLPDAAYRFPKVFLEGLNGKFGIQSYLEGLPPKK